MKVNKMEKMEKIFDLADETIQEMDETSKEITLAPSGYETVDVELSDSDIGNPAKTFELSELKKDFLIAKRGLKKLVKQGQTMMDTAQYVDLETATGSQIMAIATLSKVISEQLAMLITSYKDISEIEKNMRPSLIGESAVIKGNVTNQTINVSSADLLKNIMENMKNDKI